MVVSIDAEMIGRSSSGLPAGFSHTHTHGTSTGSLVGGAGSDPGQRRQENIERFEASAYLGLDSEIALGRDGWTSVKGAQCGNGNTEGNSGQVRGNERGEQAAGCLKRWFRQNCIRKRAETMEGISWALCSMVALTSEEGLHL